MPEDGIELAGLGSSPRTVLACGADLKGRFSLLCGGRLRLSGEFGDLADPARLAGYLAAVRRLRDEAGCDPEIVAHDLHPHYFSRGAADLFPGARRIAVQHHHAHVAAVLAQHRDGGEAIGVAFDGTGHGADGSVWGGEFLAVSPGGWKRCGRLGPLRMPGGEAAAREPWRMGISLLYAAMGDAAFDAAPLPPGAAARRRALAAMLGRGVSSPLTTSCGRLFDAVAAILGVAPGAQGEAEAAVELERRASLSDDPGEYPFPISVGPGGFEADYGGLVRALISDRAAGVPVEAMARRFHNGLASLVRRAAERIREERGCRRVALCGGAFANRILREGASRRLAGAGFELLESPRLPVNDLGICAGQTWVALREGGGKDVRGGAGDDR